jgi:hypothetical protein
MNLESESGGRHIQLQFSGIYDKENQKILSKYVSKTNKMR